MAINKHRVFTDLNITYRQVSTAIIPLLILLFGCKEKDATPGKTAVIVQWAKAKYSLSNCQAQLRPDRLNIVIRESIGTNYAPCEVWVVQKESSLVAYLIPSYSVLDSSYVPPSFKVVWARATLDKPYYKKGDQINGKVHLVSLGRTPYFRNAGEMESRSDYDTVKVEGTFSGIVQ